MAFDDTLVTLGDTLPTHLRRRVAVVSSTIWTHKSLAVGAHVDIFTRQLGRVTHGTQVGGVVVSLVVTAGETRRLEVLLQLSAGEHVNNIHYTTTL